MLAEKVLNSNELKTHSLNLHKINGKIISTRDITVENKYSHG